MKILEWDGDGFWLYFKRLERGRFQWPSTSDDKLLPLATPGLVSLPATANLSAVLELYPEGKDWLIQNHLNLVAFRNIEMQNTQRLWIDFLWKDPYWIGRDCDACWLIQRKIHLYAFVESKWASFTDFCIDSIDQNHYLLTRRMHY